MLCTSTITICDVKLVGGCVERHADGKPEVARLIGPRIGRIKAGSALEEGWRVEVIRRAAGVAVKQLTEGPIKPLVHTPGKGLRGARCWRAWSGGLELGHEEPAHLAIGDDV
eukprot:6490413-Prymnesium_polylepis.1